jgi:hypothetical protein
MKATLILQKHISKDFANRFNFILNPNIMLFIKNIDHLKILAKYHNLPLSKVGNILKSVQLLKLTQN